jgi:hypothetical protein
MTEENNAPPNNWYWMTLIGQALTGVASPFLACIPTKVSQGWFNEKQVIKIVNRIILEQLWHNLSSISELSQH